MEKGPRISPLLSKWNSINNNNNKKLFCFSVSVFVSVFQNERYCCYLVAKLCLTLCNPWTAARQASLSFTVSQSLPKLVSIDLVMPFNHLVLCCPLLLLPSIFPSIRVFSNESVLHIRWSKYWSFSFSFSINPSNEYSGLISFRIDWFDSLLSKGFSRVFSSTTVQEHQFFGTQPSL